MWPIFSRFVDELRRLKMMALGMARPLHLAALLGRLKLTQLPCPRLPLQGGGHLGHTRTNFSAKITYSGEGFSTRSRTFQKKARGTYLITLVAANFSLPSFLRRLAQLVSAAHPVQKKWLYMPPETISR